VREKILTVPLADKMLAIADRNHLPANHPLRLEAAKLNAIIGTTNDTKLLLATRDSARRAYCAFTGLPFIEKL
jgi:hypothetical protein